MATYITSYQGEPTGWTYNTIESALRDITDGKLFNDDYDEYSTGLDLMRMLLPANVLNTPAYDACDEHIRYFPAYHTDTLGDLFRNGFEALYSNGKIAIIADEALNDLVSVNNALAHVYGDWPSPRGIEGVYRIEEAAV